jgi:hypothetical protein
MSDGPHKSLNMRRAWKRLAKVLDNPNSSDDGIRECLEDAHAKDWRKENVEPTLKQIVRILDDDQASMFKEITLEKLDELRTKAGGSPMAMLLIDCVSDEVSKESVSTDTVRKGLESTLMERNARHAREMEEHYRRQSTDWRARRLTNRFSEFATEENFSGYARRLRGEEVSASTHHAPSKRTGIDDGVSL